MKLLVLAVLAAAGIGVLAFAQQGPASDAEQATARAAKPPDRFAVWSAGRHTECMISFVGEGMRRGVEIGSGCGAVYAGLERVADALVQPDGALRLSDTSGRVIVEFAPSEGFFMESVRPANALLALSEPGL